MRCDSQRNLDVDTSWLNFLTGVFLLVLPPLGIVFLVERIIVGSRDAPDVDAGAGGGVPAMIPQEILIPAGLKVVAFYTRLDVFPGAVVAGGTFDVVPRTPAVTISGPTSISVTEGTASVTRSYTLHTDDLRPPFQDDVVVFPGPFVSGAAARIPGGGRDRRDRGRQSRGAGTGLRCVPTRRRPVFASTSPTRTSAKSSPVASRSLSSMPTVSAPPANCSFASTSRPRTRTATSRRFARSNHGCSNARSRWRASPNRGARSSLETRRRAQRSTHEGCGSQKARRHL